MEIERGFMIFKHLSLPFTSTFRGTNEKNRLELKVKLLTKQTLIKMTKYTYKIQY